MGIQLIDTIQNQLLKSAELTGQWEKRLKEIENGEFSVKRFIANMMKMVEELVYEVRSETKLPRLVSAEEAEIAQKAAQKARKANKAPAEMLCPKCGKGRVLKGKNSYGCSEWKAGCKLRLPFSYLEKKLTQKQVERLVTKKATTKLKGFVVNGEKVEGILKLNAEGEIEFENKSPAPKSAPVQTDGGMPPCPKCGEGTLIKGQTAYGCNRWKAGCDFRFNFADIKTRANGKPLTKELVLEIIGG
jgi:DNA topoisomerase-3